MQLTPEQIEAEQWFWLVQDMEHCLFFVLGFRDSSLKREAEQLYTEYESAIRAGNLPQAMEILGRSQAFKAKAYEQAQRRPVGWIFPTFIDHVKRELDVMLLRTSPGGISSRDELCFVNQIGAEHAAFAAHLLDPTEVTLQNEARLGAEQAGRLASACMTQTYPTLLTMTKQVAGILDQFVRSQGLLIDGVPRTAPRVKSVIHPVLLEHVRRESDRFVARLETLPPVEETAAPPGMMQQVHYGRPAYQGY